MVFGAGRMAESGHADDTVHTDTGGNEKRKDGRDAHGPQDLAVAHQERAADRQRVLHVPDKHGPDEESNRVSRRSR